jgi:hypothetical protein
MICFTIGHVLPDIIEEILTKQHFATEHINPSASNTGAIEHIFTERNLDFKSSIRIE